LRDWITTALELSGMLSVAVMVGLLVAAWAGFGVAGAAFIAAGIIEGRR